MKPVALRLVVDDALEPHLCKVPVLFSLLMMHAWWTRGNVDCAKLSLVQTALIPYLNSGRLPWKTQPTRAFQHCKTTFAGSPFNAR